MAEKTLILGGNGLLGQYLSSLMPENAIVLSKTELDIARTELFEQYLTSHEVDTVINCAGSAAADKNDEEYLYRLNGFFPGRLAEICMKYRKRFVFISTGRVFDGTGDTPYRESDPVHPLDDYGLSKYLGERLIEKALYQGRFYIFRIPLTYGLTTSNPQKQLLLRLYRMALNGETIPVSTDSYNSPSYAADISLFLSESLAANLPNGVYHLNNSGKVSIADFVSAFFEMIGMKVSLKLVKTSFFKTPYRPALNLSFESEKLHPRRSWHEALSDFVAELKQSPFASGEF